MSCRHSSRVIPSTVLTASEYLNNTPCDVNLYIQDSDYSLKILLFEEYLLLNKVDKSINNRFYKLDCKCSLCNNLIVGHGLLWALKHYDLDIDQEIIYFDQAWNYILLKFPDILNSFKPSDINVPITGVTFPNYYGPTTSTPIDSNDVLALLSVPQSNNISLNTGITLVNFSIVVKQGMVISDVLDLDANDISVLNQYVYLGTISVLNADSNSYLYDQYEMVIGIPYQVNHQHHVTFV